MHVRCKGNPGNEGKGKILRKQETDLEINPPRKFQGRRLYEKHLQEDEIVGLLNLDILRDFYR